MRSNRADDSFTVTVEDTTAPMIDVPDDVTIAATERAGAVVEFAVIAQDAVNGAVPSECSPSSGSLFPVGTTTVVCTAADPDTQNTAAAEFSVTVEPYVVPPADDDGTEEESAPDQSANKLAVTGGEATALTGFAALSLVASAAVLLLTRRRTTS